MTNTLLLTKQVATLIDVPTLKALDAIARSERRTRGDLIRVLILDRINMDASSKKGSR